MMTSNTDHPAGRSEAQLLAESDLRQQRRSGPGGQHRNKIATGIFLTHVPTQVQASATERRRQVENRSLALQRLRIQLALLVRVDRPMDDVPSPLWSSRLRGRLLTISRQHHDFAPLLAEGLDLLHACDWKIAEAADRLGCSSSQLIGLFRKEPSAWVLVNSRRVESGLPPLR